MARRRGQALPPAKRPWERHFRPSGREAASPRRTPFPSTLAAERERQAQEAPDERSVVCTCWVGQRSRRGLRGLGCSRCPRKAWRGKASDIWGRGRADGGCIPEQGLPPSLRATPGLQVASPASRDRGGDSSQPGAFLQGPGGRLEGRGPVSLGRGAGYAWGQREGAASSARGGGGGGAGGRGSRDLAAAGRGRCFRRPVAADAAQTTPAAAATAVPPFLLLLGGEQARAGRGESWLGGSRCATGETPKAADTAVRLALLGQGLPSLGCWSGRIRGREWKRRLCSRPKDGWSGRGRSRD